jgi:uncharacterized protein YndB with AHSA1/START domain
MTQLGTITDGHTVRLERVFPVSPDQLWAYLTTPDGLRRWMAEGQIGPERAELRFLDNGSLISGPVSAWDPPRLVEFAWTGGSTQPSGSRVRFELSAEDGGTRLVLTHTLITGQAAASFAAGWHRHLDTLGCLAEGSAPGPGRPSWDQLYETYRDRG